MKMLKKLNLYNNDATNVFPSHLLLLYYYMYRKRTRLFIYKLSRLIDKYLLPKFLYSKRQERELRNESLLDRIFHRMIQRERERREIKKRMF